MIKVPASLTSSRTFFLVCSGHLIAVSTHAGERDPYSLVFSCKNINCIIMAPPSWISYFPKVPLPNGDYGFNIRIFGRQTFSTKHAVSN